MKYSPPIKIFFPYQILSILVFMVLLFTPVANAAAAGKASGPGTGNLTPEKLAVLDLKKALITYDSMNRPDPFHPFIDFSQIERSIPTDTSQPLTPLEMYALNQFNLVGIILAGDEHNYALVEDPEQIGYTIKVGDKIGNLSGQITDIKENEVIIEEPYLDIYDKQQMRTISLRLRETDEEPYPLPVQ